MTRRIDHIGMVMLLLFAALLLAAGWRALA